jgi:hypothetical protein
VRPEIKRFKDTLLYLSLTMHKLHDSIEKASKILKQCITWQTGKA